MQFLLGVDAPVSLLLVRQILLVIVLNTLLALPVYPLVRRVLSPFLPDDPRRRRRRAYTTGGLSPLSRGVVPPTLEERRPAITPQLAVRVAVLGGIAFVLFAVVFFRLWFLQVLSGDDYVTQARENRVRKVKIEAPRGDIVDRDGNRLVRTRVAPVVQIVPERPARGRARGRRRLPARAQRRPSAPARGRRPAALARAPPPRGGAALHARRAPRAPPPRPRRAARPARRRAADARRRARAAALVPPPRPRARHVAAHDPPARRRRHRRGAVLQRDGQDRRLALRLQLPQGAQGRVPRRRRREALPARLSARRARRPAVRHAARDLAGGAQEEALPRRRRRHAHRQGRHRGDLRPLPARPGRLHARRHQRARQPRRPPRGHAPRAPAGPAAAPDARPRPPARRQQRAQDRDRGRQRQRQPRQGGRVRGDGPDERRGAGARLLPLLRRQRVRQAAVAGALRRAQLGGERRAAVQPRDRRRLSDRLDVQADHRDGGARGGHHHADADDLRRRRVQARAADVRERPRRQVRPARAAAGAAGLLRRLLLHARRARQPARPDHPALGAQARPRPPDRASTSPASSTASCPTASGATRATRKYARCVKREKVPGPDARGAAEVRRHRAPLVHGRQRQPLRRPGRPAGDAAADGRRLLGDRQRRARRAAAPGDERRGRPRPRDRGVPHHRQAAREVLRDQPGDDHGRAAGRGDGARRHVGRRLRGLCGRQAHGVRQDRYRGADRAARPVLVRRLRAPSRADPSSSSSPSRRAASAQRPPLRRRA